MSDAVWRSYFDAKQENKVSLVPFFLKSSWAISLFSANWKPVAFLFDKMRMFMRSAVFETAADFQSFKTAILLSSFVIALRWQTRLDLRAEQILNI